MLRITPGDIFMNIESIHKEWEKDSAIDRTELGEEALRISSLHSKYLRLFTSERLLLIKLESDLKELKKEKYEFFIQGPTKETKDKGWELPARGMVLKPDIPIYMDADKQIIELSLKIGYQREKIDLLGDILKSINNRSYNIRAAIDFLKFTSGN